MKLEPELSKDFIAEVEVAHRPASQAVCELIREFVRRGSKASEYDEFLSHKVDAGRASVQAGVGHADDAVETIFAARRAVVTG